MHLHVNTQCTAETSSRVATQVLISLCVVGLTRAAPADQQAVVTSMVSALQPTIAQAVADALRSLRGTTSVAPAAAAAAAPGKNNGFSGVFGARA